MRPSSSNFWSVSFATSRRMPSNDDSTTACGVSSMMKSTPVRCSRARMLRPSRPMMRPFMSSDGSSTIETVVSAAWLAATRWSESATRLRARRLASICASSSSSRTRRASSWRTSSSDRVRISDFASAIVRLEIRSSSATSRSFESLISSWSCLTWVSRSAIPCSRRSSSTRRRFTSSSRVCSRSRSRTASDRCTWSSRSTWARYVTAASLASRSASRRSASASLRASVSISWRVRLAAASLFPVNETRMSQTARAPTAMPIRIPTTYATGAPPVGCPCRNRHGLEPATSPHGLLRIGGKAVVDRLGGPTSA